MTPQEPSTRRGLRVTSIERPGWGPPDTRTPAVGERVYTMEGLGEVVKVLGRTSDGSRLLELQLDDRPKPPFFAAASNVLVRSGSAATEAPEEAPTVWLGLDSSAPAAPGLRPEDSGD